MCSKVFLSIPDMCVDVPLHFKEVSEMNTMLASNHPNWKVFQPLQHNYCMPTAECLQLSVGDVMKKMLLMRRSSI